MVSGVEVELAVDVGEREAAGTPCGIEVITNRLPGTHLTTPNQGAFPFMVTLKLRP